MTSVLLGLGSNALYCKMSPVRILAGACKKLSFFMEDVRFSSLYKSKAMYIEDQSDFYNMAVYGKVPEDMSPFALLKKIHQIEADFGRNRAKEIRFGPRTLDIDIEDFGNLSIDTKDLQLPHPRICERAFVLIPALEILTESADFLLRGKFQKYLSSITVQEVFLCSDFEQTEFIAAMSSYNV